VRGAPETPEERASDPDGYVPPGIAFRGGLILKQDFGARSETLGARPASFPSFYDVNQITPRAAFGIMDVYTEIAAVLLAGLSFVLAVIGIVAAQRYHEARLGLVAAGLGTIGVVGALALVHEVSPLYGRPFEVSPIPLALLVVAVGLVYVALVRRSSRPPPP
jgi:hypothetical protein